MSYDVVTLGETMLRLTPPGFERFSQASNFEIHIGGSESNTAVGLARLGLKVAWLSRLTDNPLGRKIAEGIAEHGVDTSHVVWTNEDRVGTYYLERGKAPRGSQVFYDRQGSAMSRMQPSNLPAWLFEISNSRVLHTTGITLGISESAARTADQAARLAKKAGWLLSFDFNYRARLWSAEAAKQGCQSIMEMADIIFIPQRDVGTVYGFHDDDPRGILELLAKLFPNATIVLTMGANGAAARTRSGQHFMQPAFVAQEVERLGGGDAFSAGTLFGFLKSNDVEKALRWGAAVAAFKYTIPSDLPLIHFAEVESLVNGSTQSGVQR
ncbi:MAG: sugar kinase [Pirellulaceae bacterium]|nr:sugar kinase [Pirellulaceae bacterium]